MWQPALRRLSAAVILAGALAILAAGLGALGRPGAGAEPGSPAAPPSTRTDRSFEALAGGSRQPLDDRSNLTALALGHLQRARETGDPGLYARAEQLLGQVRASRPDDPGALVGLGTIALARHDFAAALDLGRRAVEVAPYRAAGHGVVVDAYVELGRYDQALEALQRMLDLRPDHASYARASYLRELHGDRVGAIEAMAMAVDAASPGAEPTEWARVHLGHLYFAGGELDLAEASYRRSLGLRPGYPHATAGLARVAAARGDYSTAARLYQDVTAALPSPEYVVQLAEVYRAAGQPDAAARQDELLAALWRLQADGGVDTDLELALYDVDRGLELDRAVERLRALWERRPSIHVADALAWALQARGECREAERYSREAQRLGTRDALMLFHAGRIADCLGDRERALALLGEALTTNPYFSLRHAPAAREALRGRP
jgi:tetratricopeptide (TPR) repeat protein